MRIKSNMFEITQFCLLLFILLFSYLSVLLNLKPHFLLSDQYTWFSHAQSHFFCPFPCHIVMLCCLAQGDQGCRFPCHMVLLCYLAQDDQGCRFPCHSMLLFCLAQGDQGMTGPFLSFPLSHCVVVLSRSGRPRIDRCFVWLRATKDVLSLVTLCCCFVWLRATKDVLSLVTVCCCFVWRRATKE